MTQILNKYSKLKTTRFLPCGVCGIAHSKSIPLKYVISLLYQEEKKRKREKEQCDTEGETNDFDPGKKMEVEPPPDRPVRACRTQPGEQCERLNSFGSF